MIQAVRGTRDILPDEIPAWHAIEKAARELFARYGYREIRTPVFEATELFARGIGAETDIVSKEMYTFEDRDGGSLTLRPEATAGIVRAVIEHNLVHNDPALKVYALGPMFRRERPQKGRYRQFHQVDVEAFGFTSPTIDAEVVELALAYLDACGVTRARARPQLGGRPQLPAGLRRDAARASALGRRPRCAATASDGSRRTRCACSTARCRRTRRRSTRCRASPTTSAPSAATTSRRSAASSSSSGSAYRLSHRLVRGLDYYVRTTFEVTSAELGSQSSVLGGGRYDGLVKELGGPDVAGVGFAVGIERLALLLPPREAEGRCDVFLMPLTAAALDEALRLQRALRDAGLAAMLDPEGRSFKSRMKQADKLGARFVAILGEDEMAKGVVTVRDMARSTQEDVPRERALEHLKEKANG